MKSLEMVERNLRRLLERLGSKFDSLMSNKGLATSLNSLLSELLLLLHRAIDANLGRDNRGIIAPNSLRVLLDYDTYSRINSESRQLLQDELQIAAEQYINDRRYLLNGPIAFSLSYDPIVKKTSISAEIDPPLTTKTDSNPQVKRPTAIARTAASPSPKPISSAVVQPSERLALNDASGDGAANDAGLQAAIDVNATSYRFVEARGTSYPLKDLRPGGLAIGIGRASDNSVILDDESVSKFHARLALDEAGRLVLADCGSTNGTSINGRILNGRGEVKAGDLIAFGDIELRLEKIT